jgi:transposase
VDQLVESLDLEALGFHIVVAAEEGRPAFPPGALLKLYVYGYLNKVRSSRKLAAECRRNLEVRWLLRGLTPCYHSIDDFRKVHAKALESVFRTFTGFLRQAQLTGGEVVAVDGSKFRAVNSKKNNYTHKKLERQLNYIDKKISHYGQQLKAGGDSGEAGADTAGAEAAEAT